MRIREEAWCSLLRRHYGPVLRRIAGATPRLRRLLCLVSLDGHITLPIRGSVPHLASRDVVARRISPYELRHRRLATLGESPSTGLASWDADVVVMQVSKSTLLDSLHAMRPRALHTGRSFCMAALRPLLSVDSRYASGTKATRTAETRDLARWVGNPTSPTIIAGEFNVPSGTFAVRIDHVLSNAPL